jgi:hypothetical protein
MKYNVLRASFLPIFKIETEKYNKTFILNSAYSLHLGILLDATSGLGYDKIRKSRRTNITNDELTSHLREMDEKVQHNTDRVLKSFTSGLIRLWDDETNYFNEIYHKLGKVKEEAENRNLMDEITNSEYKSQLKQKDAEIEKLREKLGKRSLLSRILN